MIVSVHLPKTAGSSFGRTLRAKFNRKFMIDFAVWPMNVFREEWIQKAMKDNRQNATRSFKNIECIHGHFLPLKYLSLAERHEVAYITWMRDPVDLVLSHYSYWNRSYRPWRASHLKKLTLVTKGEIPG